MNPFSRLRTKLKLGLLFFFFDSPGMAPATIPRIYTCFHAKTIENVMNYNLLTRSNIKFSIRKFLSSNANLRLISYSETGLSSLKWQKRSIGTKLANWLLRDSAQIVTEMSVFGEMRKSGGQFLKSPETSRAYFGCHNCLYIFATPRFWAMKLRKSSCFLLDIKSMLKISFSKQVVCSLTTVFRARKCVRTFEKQRSKPSGIVGPQPCCWKTSSLTHIPTSLS